MTFPKQNTSILVAFKPGLSGNLLECFIPRVLPESSALCPKNLKTPETGLVGGGGVGGCSSPNTRPERLFFPEANYSMNQLDLSWFSSLQLGPKPEDRLLRSTTSVPPTEEKKQANSTATTKLDEERHKAAENGRVAEIVGVTLAFAAVIVTMSVAFIFIWYVYLPETSVSISLQSNNEIIKIFTKGSSSVLTARTGFSVNFHTCFLHYPTTNSTTVLLFHDNLFIIFWPSSIGYS